MITKARARTKVKLVGKPGHGKSKVVRKRISPHTPTSTFEGFNRKVIQNSKVKWFDRKGVYPFTNNRVVEINLSTGMTSGQYERYIVSIVHKEHGKVSSKAFNFKEHLPDVPTSNLCYDGFHISEHCGIDWYKDVPSTTEPLEEAIFNYIGMFE